MADLILVFLLAPLSHPVHLLTVCMASDFLLIMPCHIHNEVRNLTAELVLSEVCQDGSAVRRYIWIKHSQISV